MMTFSSTSRGILSLSIALAVGAASPPALALSSYGFPDDEVVTGADWSTTFAPEAVGTYLGDGKPKIIVIGATSASKEAAAALRAGLKQSGRAGLVMDDTAIGAVHELDDTAIVERAKTQPVDRIAIVRVFEGGPGEPSDVVVSFYDAQGKVADALTGTAGTRVPFKEGLRASSGVTAEAAEVVSELANESDAEVDRDTAALQQAEREYESKYLWFEEWIGVSVQTGAVVARWSKMKQGKYGTDLRGPKVYEIVGRDDLVKKYRRRQGVRFGVGFTAIAGGAALMGAGTSIVISNITARGPDFGYDDPIGEGNMDPSTRYSKGAGWAMSGVGIGLMVFGSVFVSVFKPHPVSKAEAGELMEGYNRKLRKDLGLPAERRASVQISPVAGVNNGFVVSGRF